MGVHHETFGAEPGTWGDAFTLLEDGGETAVGSSLVVDALGRAGVRGGFHPGGPEARGRHRVVGPAPMIRYFVRDGGWAFGP